MLASDLQNEDESGEKKKAIGLKRNENSKWGWVGGKRHRLWRMRKEDPHVFVSNPSPSGDVPCSPHIIRLLCRFIATHTQYTTVKDRKKQSGLYIENSVFLRMFSPCLTSTYLRACLFIRPLYIDSCATFQSTGARFTRASVFGLRFSWKRKSLAYFTNAMHDVL